jgi:hypothetical protein
MNLFFIPPHIFRRRSSRALPQGNIHWTPSVCSVRPIHPPNGMACVHFSDRSFLIYAHIVATHPRNLYHESTLWYNPNPRSRCSQVEESGALWCRRRYTGYNARTRHECQCFFEGETVGKTPLQFLYINKRVQVMYKRRQPQLSKE